MPPLRLPIAPLLLVLSVAPAAAQQPRAAPGRPGQTPVEGSGCLVWNEEPSAEGRVTSTGEFVKGRTAGRGVPVWRWRDNGVDHEADHSGEMRDGRANGQGTCAWASGATHVGPRQRGLCRGIGFAREANGTVF